MAVVISCAAPVVGRLMPVRKARKYPFSENLSARVSNRKARQHARVNKIVKIVIISDNT